MNVNEEQLRVDLVVGLARAQRQSVPELEERLLGLVMRVLNGLRVEAIEVARAAIEGGSAPRRDEMIELIDGHLRYRELLGACQQAAMGGQ